jgi:uncharacterized protein Yka (UPF0111/DUF47 family)
MSKEYKAKKEALKKFKKVMSKMGGDRYSDGMSATVSAKNPKDLAEGLETAAEMMEEVEEVEEVETDYDSMSRDDLIKLLKHK